MKKLMEFREVFMGNLFLSDNDLKKIHASSVDILEKTGIRLLHGELIEYLSNFAGIKIDKRTNTLRFNSEIIHDSIKKAKKKFKLFGRDRKRNLA